VGLTRAGKAAEQAGLLHEAALDALGIAVNLERRWDFAGMREALAWVDPVLVEDRLDTELQQAAVTSLMTGDLRKALGSAESCAERAEQFDLQDFRLWTGQLRLQVLAELGRLAEGRALVEAQLSGLDAAPCERARIHANVGWLELVGSG
jgi:hypothetical protein